jgi:hypothetical protein
MEFFLSPCSAICAPAFRVPLARTHPKVKVSLASLVQTSERKRNREEGGFRPSGGDASETS